MQKEPPRTIHHLCGHVTQRARTDAGFQVSCPPIKVLLNFNCHPVLLEMIATFYSMFLDGVALKRAVEVGARTIERVVAGRYEWRDAGMGEMEGARRRLWEGSRQWDPGD